MKRYVIRNAERQDIPGICSIEQEAFSVPMTADQIAALLPDGNHVLLVAVPAESRDVIIGYAEETVILDEGYISNIAVRKDRKREGVGSLMMEGILSAGRKADLSFVSLEVRESNTAAIALYSAFSFEQAGILKNHYSKPKENAIVMTYFFKNH